MHYVGTGNPSQSSKSTESKLKLRPTAYFFSQHLPPKIFSHPLSFMPLFSYISEARLYFIVSLPLVQRVEDGWKWNSRCSILGGDINMGRRCGLLCACYHLHHHRACHPSHRQGKFVSILIITIKPSPNPLLHQSEKPSPNPLGADGINHSF